ncbi:hypothetical protein UK23_08165 [Lentzea aerocolonigenes]|uniref:Uncharacterized protein n=1 Tax=Lentzea aerocolonigenes TaxID=68170 RepID=A0A0F0H630_LENAE|nr:hypothetical protein [Lentzea aerocolonigenes]KJK51184.1 hypothetical protein UK23_08165 [Lentzea aerocolonigenes]
MTFKKIAAGTLAAAALAVLAPASAQADPSTEFETGDGYDYTKGTITWHNRTVTISGYVIDEGAGWTEVRFRVFAGSTQIGAQESRYTDDASTNPVLRSPRRFELGMGDTNRPGGVTKVEIAICHTKNTCDQFTTRPRP